MGFNYNYVLDEINNSIYQRSESSVSVLLIKKKFLFYIPLGAIVITYRYLIKKKAVTTNTLFASLALVALISILLFFKNPLVEKRNALGPIYITLIFLFYPKLINSNSKFFFFLFLSMIVAFPLISTITHLDASLEETIANPEIFFKLLVESGSISTTFNSLHYDAYSNILATVEYTQFNGFSFGYLLLGSGLFFVPRSLWASKPITTGKEVGSYLIETHSFGDGKFNNLSNPIISEGYINFGVLGVILMFLILAYVIVIFLKWFSSSDSLKQLIAFYFAIHLIFLLRGDLTNGFAYFIGPFLGAYVFPKIVKRFFRK
ncbi:O-antigen polysaccharide polymerase Wzy [Winogradskyella sp. PE311]|uniref:O-antigen polysaccharide polymerase Wzy n=1 Tax=Winogradskyella sp. PE311 TaxID=3366943 RepID=UPI00397EC7DE